LRSRLSASAEQRLLSVALGRTPAPRAWDDFFSERPTAYLRIRVDGDTWLAGRFAADSYAGGFPQDTDIFLEEAWSIDGSSGELGEVGLGFPLYIPAASIRWIEILPAREEGQGESA
jgi:hypothetical protein